MDVIERFKRGEWVENDVEVPKELIGAYVEINEPGNYQTLEKSYLGDQIEKEQVKKVWSWRRFRTEEVIIPERIHRSTVFRFKKAQGRQYKIIDCDWAWELAEDINRMVSAGWLPDGDVFRSEYRINDRSYRKFYQKMVIDYDKIEVDYD